MNKQLIEVDFSNQDYQIFLPESYKDISNGIDIVKSIFGKDTKVFFSDTKETNIFYSHKEQIKEQINQPAVPPAAPPIVNQSVEALKNKIRGGRKKESLSSKLPEGLQIG